MSSSDQSHDESQDQKLYQEFNAFDDEIPNYALNQLFARVQ